MSYELKSITPNLVVADVARSVAFYRDVLGFEVMTTVPDAPPFVFAMLHRGPVQVFVNSREAAVAEYPMFKEQRIGGTLTLFLDVAGVRRAYDELKDRAQVVMPLEVKWYGMTEFAIEDPDGYVITFAEREVPAAE